MTIAITGASGRYGELVIDQLLARHTPATSILALVRTPSKLPEKYVKAGIVVRSFDYNDSSTLVTGLEGVKSLLLVSSTEVGRRIAQHTAVIDAAKTAGVDLIVYTSLLRADRSPLQLAPDHRETEAYLSATGLKYVILRNGWYLENWIPALSIIKQHSTLVSGARDGKFSPATRADYASAAVMVLTSPPDSAKIYELAGDESFTMAELAAELSKLFNKEIKVVQKTHQELVQIYVGAGYPTEVASVLAQCDVAAADDALYDDNHELSALIGRRTEDWRKVLEKAVHLL